MAVCMAFNDYVVCSYTRHALAMQEYASTKTGDVRGSKKLEDSAREMATVQSRPSPVLWFLYGVLVFVSRPSYRSFRVYSLALGVHILRA